MTSASYLYDVGLEILSVAEDSLSEDRTGNSRPNRVNVAWGTPPADECCEFGGQLTIHLASDNPAVFHESNKCVIRVYAEYVITLFRCVPTLDDGGQAPTANELSTSAAKLMADLWALLTGLYDALGDESLFTGVACSNVQFGNVDILDPEGGCAGFTVRLSLLANDPGATVS